METHFLHQIQRVMCIQLGEGNHQNPLPRALCVPSMLGMCLVGSGLTINTSTQCRGQERKFLNKPQGGKGVYGLTEPVDHPCKTQRAPTDSQINAHAGVLTEVSRSPPLTGMKMSHYCKVKSMSWGSVVQLEWFRIQHPSSVAVTHSVYVSAAVINTPTKKKRMGGNSSLYLIGHCLPLGSQGRPTGSSTQHHLQSRNSRQGSMAEAMEEAPSFMGSCLASIFKEPRTSWVEIVLPTVDWAFLHQCSKQSPMWPDMPTGQSDQGNPSTEIPFSGDSRFICQTDS